MATRYYPSVKDYGGLDGGLVFDAFQCLPILLQRKDLIDNTLGLDLAVVEVINGLSLRMIC